MRSGYTKYSWNNGGLSLIEVLVAAALSLMLLGLFWTFLVPAFGYYVRGAARAELQQSALVAGEKVVADLRRSAPGGISIRSAGTDSPTVLAVHPLETVTADGTQVWSDQLTIYFWWASDGRLWAKKWPPGPPEAGFSVQSDKPIRVDEATLLEVAQERNGTETMLAENVARFEVVDAAPEPGISRPVTLTLEFEKETSSGPQRLTVSQDVFLRNSQ
ncbi:MAG: type II secretion system protein [Armatimonadetes bacterium]|nr:type II secretion system protein [Armatimonadota bacterium]